MDALADAVLAPGGLRGRKLVPPDRFEPDTEALAYHRTHVFRAEGRQRTSPVTSL